MFCWVKYLSKKLLATVWRLVMLEFFQGVMTNTESSPLFETELQGIYLPQRMQLSKLGARIHRAEWPIYTGTRSLWSKLQDQERM